MTRFLADHSLRPQRLYATCAVRQNFILLSGFLGTGLYKGLVIQRFLGLSNWTEEEFEVFEFEIMIPPYLLSRL